MSLCLQVLKCLQAQLEIGDSNDIFRKSSICQAPYGSQKASRSFILVNLLLGEVAMVFDLPLVEAHHQGTSGKSLAPPTRA